MGEFIGRTHTQKQAEQPSCGRQKPGPQQPESTDLLFRPVGTARSQGVPNLNMSPGSQGTATFGADENVLKWIMVMVAQYCEYTKKQ